MSERQLEQLDRLSSLFEKVTDDAVATLKELDIARLQIADLKAKLADANRGAQVNALVNKSLTDKLAIAVEALEHYGNPDTYSDGFHKFGCDAPNIASDALKQIGEQR